MRLRVSSLVMLWVAIGMLACGTMPAEAGDLTLTRVSRVETQSGQAMETTTTLLVHEHRSRSDFQSMSSGSVGDLLGPHVAIVMQCDLRQVLTIDLDHKVYSVSALPPVIDGARLATASAADPQAAVGESLDIVRNVIEGEEQHSGFGRVLRRYSIHEERTPSAGAHARASQEDREGWWVEIPEYEQLHGCDPVAGLRGKPQGGVTIASSGSEPMNYRVNFRSQGPPVLGYPADVTSVERQEVRGPGGAVRAVTSRSLERIIELSTARLDPALFDVPAGFGRIDHVETGVSGLSLNYQLKAAWARLMHVFTK